MTISKTATYTKAIQQFLEVSPEEWEGFTERQKKIMEYAGAQIDRKTELIHTSLIQRMIYSITGDRQHTRENHRLEMYLDDMLEMIPEKDKNLGRDSYNYICDIITDQLTTAMIKAYTAGLADSRQFSELTDVVLDDAPSTAPVYDVLDIVLPPELRAE